MAFVKILSKYILPVLPFLLVFVASLYHPYDSDLGWHLKYGEYFFQHGTILRENIFSTEMADYKWPNSSWGTDLISYVIFNNFGFLGLSFAAAAAITLSFYFMSRAAQMGYFEKVVTFPVFLYLINPVVVVGFRGQLVSLLFISVLAFLLKLYQEKRNKLILLIIPLFMFWSNVHGAYFLGIGLFVIWTATYLAVEFFNLGFKINRTLLNEAVLLASVFLLSVAASLVNPFGIAIWQEALRHFMNPYMKFIYEWLPFEERSGYWWSQVAAGLLLFFGAIFIVFSGKLKEKLPWIVTVAVLYLISFNVRRYSWPMYYFTFPAIAAVAEFFRPPSKKVASWAGTIIVLAFIAITVFSMKPFDRVKNVNWSSYCQIIGCPINALEFMRNSKIEGKLLSFYDWGGFMIWNYPEIKPSIDGRMHLWKNEKGYSAFAYYYPYEQDRTDINDTNYTVVLMGPQKPLYNQMLDHVDDGTWKIIYEDIYAGVFVRN